MSVVTYIGLGSNLGDSRKILTEAVAKLAALGRVKTSKLYQSPPMGPQDQPHYLNAVARLETDLAALDLLDELQKIEQEAGRVRLRHWGERTLDLDILLYGQEQIEHQRLTVPHIGLLERDFVIMPLLDLDKNIQIKAQCLKDLALAQDSTLLVVADEFWSAVD